MQKHEHPKMIWLKDVESALKSYHQQSFPAAEKKSLDENPASFRAPD